ncbi:type VI secretion system baseplate subunit TssF, partial [bacterium]|nr:type VI secretion system baseplate subunit TssF [bacterium]
MTGETPLVPSLLDRLLDDDPAASREPASRQAAVVAGIRAGLCRDLRDLLNAHRFLSAAVERYPEVASSLANYGLPDLQSLEIREDHDLQSLCRSIAETIRRFEPRLVDVRVAPRREEGGQRSLDRRVRFDTRARGRAAARARAAHVGARREQRRIRGGEPPMNDDILPYYERELGILRGLAGQFAEQHPKVAARLRLGRDESQDPHVERLLQGAAFLAADVQKRLDDDFPELTDGLLDLLLPHALRPVPSMAIVRMAIDPKQAALTAGYLVPRGTELQTEEVEGERCTYRTCFATRLWPLRIAAVQLGGPPFTLPLVPPAGTAAVLSIGIETLAPGVKISQMAIESLRLHLHADAGQPIAELYELLLTRCAGVVLFRDADDPAPVVLPKEALVPAGFAADEAALPHDPRVFSGYRLLTEFFTLPQKYLFIDLCGLTPERLAGFGSSM